MTQREEEKRIDRKHRFQLRIDEAKHAEIDELSFKHDMSLNVLYCEAISYSMKNPAFRRHLQEKFSRDERRGHFVYVQSGGRP